MSTYPVSDKVALVTGAARGIGLETARELVARGARVAVVDLDAREVSAAAAELGPDAIGIAADVTDAAAMKAAVDEVVAQLGRLDIVIANAGVAPRAATVRSMDPSVFERVLEVNVLGVHRTVAAALPHIVANRGHVVVVASIYAFTNGVLMAPYAMSKAAVEQYGRALRGELAGHGASAGVVYFGFIETAMTHEVIADPVGSRLEQSFPRFLMRRLHPSLAGKAVVKGVERRAARVVTPGRWVPLSVLRGVVNPAIDRRMERNATIQSVIRAADGAREVTEAAR